ncbi:MAG: diguanylate cyclase (GGDEF)-like protein [Gammaproteobacteria bacterium]
MAALRSGAHEVCLVDYSSGPRKGTDLLVEANRLAIETPIIMLTGMANRQVDPQAMEMGAADYLVKSEVAPGMLDRSIRYVIECAKLVGGLGRLVKQDALTGLANRVLLRDFLAGAIARTRRSGQLMAVLVLDLDHFKDVNDQFGHDAGDERLEHVARALQCCVRAGDFVARMGGDEFAIVHDNIDTPSNAELISAKVNDCLRNTIILQGDPIAVDTSIGIACFDGGDNNSGDLLKAADAAMYESKRAGRGSHWMFEPDMESLARQRAARVTGFVKCIDADVA